MNNTAVTEHAAHDHSHNILVIDDEVNVCKAISRSLKQQRYTIVTASNGQDGLQLLKQQHFSVIISDQCMPGMQGTELLKLARQLSPNTVRILLTAHADVNALQQAINQGEIYRFLIKPWDSATLTENIDDAIAYHELITERERISREIQNKILKLSRVNKKLAQQISDQNQQLAFATQYDLLTLLPNRALLEDRLALIVSEAGLSQKTIAVLAIDIDRFGLINQSMGYKTGDRILLETAQRLLRCVRADDSVARLSGDEFVMVLQGLEQRNDIEQIIKRLHVELVSPYHVDDKDVYLSVSIGVSLFDDDGHDANALLEEAETALKYAKTLGCGAHQYFDKKMNQSVKRMADLERRLHCALERDEFQVYYQPQIDLRSGEIVGAEALLRWRPKDGDTVSPAEFVPILEDTGMILHVGEFVLSAVVKQINDWGRQNFKRVRIGVNLSARQFQSSDLVPMIESLLTGANIPRHVIELEITETFLMLDVNQAIRTLMDLQALGASLAIDDFGTGYASLNYLTRFPVNALKIDRSFVQGVSKQNNDKVTSAIVALGKSLDLRVIAEGAETEAQVQYLRKLDCDEVQGYFFSAAVTSNEFEAMLRDAKQYTLQHR